jgi:hypothetical protein
MLDRARHTLSRREHFDRLMLAELDMTVADQAPGGPFGLAIFSLNGLMHLASISEQRIALEAAWRALDPRGMLVIDLLNPSPEHLVSFDGRIVHEGTWHREDRATISRFSVRTHSFAEQRIETELWYDVVEPNGRLRRIRTEFPMRYLTRFELELMLELSGFVEWKTYGSYDLDPYDDGSERLIVTAEVTPS